MDGNTFENIYRRSASLYPRGVGRPRFWAPKYHYMMKARTRSTLQTYVAIGSGKNMRYDSSAFNTFFVWVEYGVTALAHPR